MSILFLPYIPVKGKKRFAKTNFMLAKVHAVLANFRFLLNVIFSAESDSGTKVGSTEEIKKSKISANTSTLKHYNFFLTSFSKVHC